MNDGIRAGVNGIKEVVDIGLASQKNYYFLIAAVIVAFTVPYMMWKISEKTGQKALRSKAFTVVMPIGFIILMLVLYNNKVMPLTTDRIRYTVTFNSVGAKNSFSDDWYVIDNKDGTYSLIKKTETEKQYN